MKLFCDIIIEIKNNSYLIFLWNKIIIKVAESFSRLYIIYLQDSYIVYILILYQVPSWQIAE